MSSRYFVPTLALLVGLWFACWLIGRTPITATVSRKWAAWGSGALVAAAIGLFGFTFLLQELKLPWKDFSPTALSEARAAGKTVMVDFTADWCPNCKWNLKFAIDTEAVRQKVDQNKVVPMIADWTDQSAEIKDFLTAELGRQSIPVLAIWPANAADEDVIILDGTIRKAQVLEALEQAGPSNGQNALASRGPPAPM